MASHPVNPGDEGGEMLEGYGRASEKAKLAQKLANTLDLLRGHLNYSVLHEHDTKPLSVLSQLYYPAEPSV